MAKKDKRDKVDEKAKAKVKKPQSAAKPESAKPAATKRAAAMSPLAPAAFPVIPVIAGVEFAAAQAGIKHQNRADVMLVRLAPGTVVAGVFTRSATRAASVLDCQAKLGRNVDASAGAAILVNSGNANAFTGAAGVAAVDAVTAAVATALSLPQTRVFSASTGVIGQPLPETRITAQVGALVEGLAAEGIAGAANAIMTTDTFAKGAFAELVLDGHVVRIAGIAKGSGMIAPDLATMLVYVFTDAKIAQPALQRMLSRLADETVNCVTVDGDTSTSDMVLLAATGQSAAPELRDMRGKPARAFEAALRGVMLDLAQQVVRDGEGATKFVEVSVSGAADASDARKVAFAVANSPLVKTALAGEDPNWGRIVMAVGKSGAQADRDKLTLHFGALRVAQDGRVDPDYLEADGAAYMKRAELQIRVGLGLGSGAATVWTCDLTHRYIEINADYRS